MANDISCDIIIPTYNGASHLPLLLASLEKQSFERYACYVIDDNSSDGTVDLVRRDFPWVNLIVQPENMGPAHNRNVAARAGHNPYLIIFDDDAYLDDAQWIRKALQYMEENPEVGQLAAMIVNGFDPDILLDCGIVKRWYLFGGTFHNICCSETQGKHDRARTVLGACSAGTVLRRELFDRVGGFDAEYFYPCEDLDLSLRIHLAGYDVRYEPGLKVFHFESQAMGNSLARKMFLYRRNCLRVLCENFPAAHVMKMLLLMCGREILNPWITFFWGKISGRRDDSRLHSAKDYARSLLFLLQNLASIMKKRKKAGLFLKRPRTYLLQLNNRLLSDLQQ